MPQKLLILFSKNDFKFKMWSSALARENVKCISTSSLAMFSKLPELLRHRGYKKAVVFRYLNDRKSFLKSFFFLISDVATCGLCFLIGAKRLWILHNIDNESQANHKAMIRFRRRLVARCAERILVTDPLLIDDARSRFSEYSQKIDSLTFGKYEPNLITKEKPMVNDVVEKDLKYFKLSDFDVVLKLVRDYRQQYDFVGFCGGKFSKKRVNFVEIPKLIEAAQKSQNKLLLVIISDMKKEDNPELFDFLMNTTHVLFINCLLELDEVRLSEVIDFYWSGYSDISIPFTLYTAASVGRPMLSTNSGVLPKLLNFYEIGDTMNEDYSNIAQCLERTRKVEQYRFSEFLNTHSWEAGASSILNAINEDSA